MCCRLHASEPEPMPTPAEIKEREAYDAWVGFYYHLDGREYRNQHEEDEREAELFRQYGEAPMWALIIPGPGTSRSRGSRLRNFTNGWTSKRPGGRRGRRPATTRFSAPA